MTDKRIRIILDSKSAESNAKKLDGAVVGVGKSADRTAFSMNKLAAAIAAVISVQKIREYSDAWASVQNQLRQTVQTQEQLAAVSQRIINIAIDSRASLEETSQLYTRFRLSVDETTLSNERLFNIVETINKSLALSGATASESAGALRQLSQAIASGVLRGEEFNSIAEQAPGIFRAIQKETGLTAGELRKFAQEGGITTDILIKSLEAYRSTVDSEFGKSKATIAQAFEVSRTNLVQFIGTLNDVTGASEAFAQMIIDVSKTINDPSVISGLIEFFYLAKNTINATADSLSDFQDEFTFAGQTASEATGFIGQAFKNILPNIRAFVEVITVEAIAVIDKLKASAIALYEVLSNPFDEDANRKSMEEYERSIAVVNDARQRTLQDIFDEREAIISTSAAAAEARRKEIEDRRKMRETEGGSVPQFSGGLISGSTAGKKARESSGAQEIENARSVTEALKLELSTRRQISDAYRVAQSQQYENQYEYELALLQAKTLEEAALTEQRYAEDTQRRQEQQRQALDDDLLTAEERFYIGQYYDEQEKISAQLKQEELTAIEEKAKNDRIAIAKAERQAKLDLMFSYGDASVALLQAFGSKSEKKQKQYAKVGIGVDTARGIARGVALGWPMAIPAVAYAIATGKMAMDRLNNAGSSAGGAPNLNIGGAGGSSEGINTNTGINEQIPQQKKIYDLRGVKADDKISVAAFAQLLEDDGAVVVLESAREDAARRGTIGVTAR